MDVYVDGAYSSSSNCGGIGIVFVGKGTYHKRYRNTTSQRMELRAALVALKSVIDKEEDLTIYSDSSYLVNSINKKYNLKANLDLWNSLFSEIKKFKKVTFVLIKGHAGIKYNEEADQLAQEASRLV